MNNEYNGAKTRGVRVDNIRGMRLNVEHIRKRS